MITGEGKILLQRAVRLVALLNLAYFGLEFAVARLIGSVSLFADSIDFLEDASVNLLVLFALSWSARQRARVGLMLAAILLIPSLATLWTAWRKFEHPSPPNPVLLSFTGFGAMFINLGCAYLLAAHRTHGGSLTRAAFLSARNDVFANIFIVGAGVLGMGLWESAWPDLLVGFGIMLLNADAAREVWMTARQEASMIEL
ncbi:MAG: cation transporter [Acidocella sp.]|nr:cation transporter [Acidocella sp.]